jgi:hypothetical protein
MSSTENKEDVYDFLNDQYDNFTKFRENNEEYGVFYELESNTIDDITDCETNSQLSLSEHGAAKEGSSSISTLSSILSFAPSLSSASKCPENQFSLYQTYTLIREALLLQETISSPKIKIIFSLPFADATVICRSFTCKVTGISETLQVSLQGFRIVHSDSGANAEFKIFCKFNNGLQLIVWRRYSDFVSLADEIDEAYSELPLESSRQCWERVLEMKSWFRNLSIVYLIRKSARLEDFLYSVLFDLDCPNLFLKFLSRF